MAQGVEMSEENIAEKILIIDDEKENTESIKALLQDVHYLVETAHSATEAKNLVAVKDFDLILLDVWMPGGQDGMSLLEEWNKTGFDTPVVMISGHAEPSDIVKALQLGAIDFWKKPLPELLSKIRNLLTRQAPVKSTQEVSGIDFSLKLKEARNIFEKQYLEHHLTLNDNNIAIVAEKAGLERTTLYRKLKDLGIDKR